MMKKSIFFITAILMMACSSQKDLSKLRENWPHWVKSKPVSEAYYIGIGSASKTADINRYKKVARQNALSNLAGEISVNISSSSVLHTMEVDYNVSEHFTSNITTSSEEELEGYELVDNYEDEFNYFVYYRLSKSLYRKLKEEKISQAVDKAKSEWTKANHYITTGEYQKALQSQIKGLDEVSAFLNEPLATQFKGKQVYLANELLSEVQLTLDQIRIRPLSAKTEAIRGCGLTNKELGFQLMDNAGKPLKQVPLKAEFSAQSLVFDKTTSNPEGIAYFRLDKITTKSASGIFRVSLDMEEILRPSTNNLTIRKVIRQMHLPSSKMDIKIIEPVFHIEANEKNLDRPLERTILKQAFTRALEDEGYSVSPNAAEAHFKIEIDANTQREKKLNAHHTTLLSYSIRVSDYLHNNVYTTSVDNIEGNYTSFEKAGLKAYEKGAAEIRLNTFDEMLYTIF